MPSSVCIAPAIAPEFFPFLGVESPEIRAEEVTDRVVTGGEYCVLVKLCKGLESKVVEWATDDAGFAAIKAVLMPRYKGWRFSCAIDAPLPF